jgi:Holliday junction resolvase RusA-like endonuclease
MNGQLVCEFLIDGTPVQQGSKTAFVVKGRAIVTDQNAKTLKPWRKHVTRTAAAAYSGPRLDGPVGITAEFRFLRPPSVTRLTPHVQPDIDKLVRSLYDGITDAKTIWRDDAQVVEEHSTKVYAAAAGVHVRIYVIEGTV